MNTFVQKSVVQKCILLSSLALAPALQAADEKHIWNGHLGVGARYDSNIAVIELDQSTNESDQALEFEGSVGYRYQATRDSQLRASLHASETQYDDFEQFDLRTLRASVGGHTSFEQLEVGIDVHEIAAYLQDERFLSMTQAAPYIAHLFDDRFYVRATYTYTDKTFADNPARDAQADALAADAYLFMNQARTYAAIGFKVRDESADEARFDFDSQGANARFSHKLPVLKRDLKLLAQASYEHRDYSNLDPTIGAQRQDERLQFKLSATLPLTDLFEVSAILEHNDNRSNLDPADFHENIAALQIGAQF